MLRAESLINDGTALVVFAIAVEVATGTADFGWPGVIRQFAVSYIGGVAVGLVVAWRHSRGTQDHARSTTGEHG